MEHALDRGRPRNHLEHGAALLREPVGPEHAAHPGRIEERHLRQVEPNGRPVVQRGTERRLDGVARGEIERAEHADDAAAFWSRQDLEDRPSFVVGVVPARVVAHVGPPPVARGGAPRNARDARRHIWGFSRTAPTLRRMRVTWQDVGHIRVATLLDGDADIETPLADAFADFPSDALASYADRVPGLSGASGAWHLYSRAWLVVHPGGVVLVDTGVGGGRAPAAGWVPEPGRLHDALREAGATADQIDTVVISHVHDDHLGGAVTDDDVPVPAFPRAKYLIQRDDIAFQREAATESDDDREILERSLEPLLAAGVVETLDGHHRLADGIELRHAPGHTPGHQIVRISSKGRRLTISADAFLHPAQLAHPDWPASTDAHPSRAAATRRELIASLFSNPGTIVAPTHLDVPFGTVATGRDGLAAWQTA